LDDCDLKQVGLRETVPQTVQFARPGYSIIAGSCANPVVRGSSSPA